VTASDNNSMISFGDVVVPLSAAAPPVLQPLASGPTSRPTGGRRGSHIRKIDLPEALPNDRNAVEHVQPDSVVNVGVHVSQAAEEINISVQQQRQQLHGGRARVRKEQMSTEKGKPERTRKRRTRSSKVGKAGGNSDCETDIPSTVDKHGLVSIWDPEHDARCVTARWMAVGDTVLIIWLFHLAICSVTYSLL
jgi:hypothetical protein